MRSIGLKLLTINFGFFAMTKNVVKNYLYGVFFVKNNHFRIKACKRKFQSH